MAAAKLATITIKCKQLIESLKEFKTVGKNGKNVAEDKLFAIAICFKNVKILDYTVSIET